MRTLSQLRYRFCAIAFCSIFTPSPIASIRTKSFVVCSSKFLLHQVCDVQRFLSSTVLARISGLDLVAKTVVDGFVAGLHRSPDFGFSQEFAEYRAYSPGDDLRHVDWNVFARTERAFLKKYRGETNTSSVVLLDSSASMGFGGPVRKFDYAKYLASSLVYLAHLQRDS